MIPKRQRTLFERIHDRTLRLFYGPRYKDRSWSLQKRLRVQRRRKLLRQTAFASFFLMVGILLGFGMTTLLDRDTGREALVDASSGSVEGVLETSTHTQEGRSTGKADLQSDREEHRAAEFKAPVDAASEEPLPETVSVVEEPADNLLFLSDIPAALDARLEEVEDDPAAIGFYEILTDAYGLPSTATERADTAVASADSAELGLEREAEVESHPPEKEPSVEDLSEAPGPTEETQESFEVAAVSLNDLVEASQPAAQDDLVDPVAREIAEAMKELQDLQRETVPSVQSSQTWLANAAPFNREAGKPMIAIVIDDLGMNRPGTRRTIDLPPPVTLAFLTYAEGLAADTERARGRGHELMVHVPMEPLDREHNYPGPEALSVDLTEAQIKQRLDWALTRFSGFVGINNHMGSRFTSNREGMRIVMERLRADGLLFLDSVTSQSSVGHETARHHNVPSVARDIFLDHEQSSDFVWSQLQQLETIARRQGTAIAIGHPHGVTLAALEAWIPDAKERGFQFVPVTAIVRERDRGFAFNAASQ